MVDNAASWKNFIEYAKLTDIGLRRSNNQDSFAVVLAGDEQEFYRRGHLFLVADGMGAHAAGELASKLSATGIPHTYHKLIDRPPPEALQQAFVEANANIHGRGQANAEFQGMGTTTCVLALLPEGAVVAHVGDSRVYRLREHRLEQLTFDHSLVWEMMAAGQMPKGEVPAFVPKNIITRSLGPHPDVQVDLEGPFELQVGDIFLMCSDGLSGQVRDDEICLILSALSPEEAVRVLVDLANLRGGPDNITVIVIRVVGALAPPTSRAENNSYPATNHERSRSTNPAPWIVGVVCLLAAAILGLSGNVWPAIGVGAGASLMLAALAVWRFSSSGPAPRPAMPGGPLGRGPHTSLECIPGHESVAGFAQVAGKLREAAIDEQWQVDWNRFNAYQERAQQASLKSNWMQAVREYALAISFMMDEIRHKTVKRS